VLTYVFRSTPIGVRRQLYHCHIALFSITDLNIYVGVDRSTDPRLLPPTA
jgi:hypothetical protein